MVFRLYNITHLLGFRVKAIYTTEDYGGWTGNDVIEEIVDILIHKERAWKAGIRSVFELNETAVEHVSQVVDLLSAAVAVTYH